MALTLYESTKFAYSMEKTIFEITEIDYSAVWVSVVEHIDTLTLHFLGFPLADITVAIGKNIQTIVIFDS